jgi:hypothetical protein
MATIHQPSLAPPLSFPHALELALSLALAQYPDEAARIQRGYGIAMQGGVRLCGSGFAEVQSQRHPTTWYEVHERCHCWDSKYAPDGRCKHWWGKRLLVWAQTSLAQTAHPHLPDAPVTPYDFPRWTRYEATYQGPRTAMQPVNGIAELLAPGWFFFQPDEGGDGWDCAYQEVALGPGIAEQLLAFPQPGRLQRRALPAEGACSTEAGKSGRGIPLDREAI